MLECKGFLEEIGSDNGKELKNNLLEGYLKVKNIKFIRLSYNLNSQGIDERFHKIIKVCLYSTYLDDKDDFDLWGSLDFVAKNIITMCIE